MKDETQVLKDIFEENEILCHSDSLHNISIDEYKEQTEKLFYYDHHDFIRMTPGGPYIAVYAEQVDVIIDYLKSLKKNMHNM